MKKLLVLALVLSMASMASAALTLSVSDTEMVESDTAVISISGDGASTPGQYWMGIVVNGPGSLNIDNVTVLYKGSDASVAWMDNSDIAPFIAADLGGVDNPFLSVSLMDTPPQGTNQLPLGPGMLVNNIILHCDGVGDVVVVLTDGDGNVLDSKTISQITPEPITIGLLGLGAMFLRRRK